MDPRQTSAPHRPHRGRVAQGGFTLVELVTAILILGVLAAFALPRYADFAAQARVAKVQNMAGVLRATAGMFKAKCLMTTGCNAMSPWTSFTFSDTGYLQINYGYPEAGDQLGWGQIDTLVDTAGFVLSLPDNLRTKFAAADAPDPTNCAVVYLQATNAANAIPTTSLLTSGC